MWVDKPLMQECVMPRFTFDNNVLVKFDYYENGSRDEWIAGFQISGREATKVALNRYFMDGNCNIAEILFVVSYTTSSWGK